MMSLRLAMLLLSASSAHSSSCAAPNQAKCEYGSAGTSLLQVAASKTGVILDTQFAQEPAADAKKAEAADGKSDAAADEKKADNAAPANASAPAGGTNATTGANATNATDATNVTNGTNATNATNATNETVPVPTGCAVKEDPRVKAWFAETSPVGTPCVFGVDGDARDEGSHCIFDNGDFGSNGWCYTSKDRSSWGSCNDLCPLYGPSKQLGQKLDHVDKMVDKVMGKLD